MNTLKRILPLLLLLLCLPRYAGAQQQDQFTFILPAPALLWTLQALLPLPLETDDSTLSGTINIDSIDTLAIHDGRLTLHGVLTGKNLSINTAIAGQNIKLRLGQLILPLSCDLLLRFDRAGQRLFFTPLFKPGPDGKAQNSEAVLPLMAALNNREFPVDLKKLLTLNPTIGGTSRPLRVETTWVSARDNQLVLRLRPQKSKSD